jgi:hypothetical protein
MNQQSHNPALHLQQDHCGQPMVNTGCAKGEFQDLDAGSPSTTTRSPVTQRANIPEELEDQNDHRER